MNPPGNIKHDKRAHVAPAVTPILSIKLSQHKVPTSESDLFVFLEFSPWTCPGRIYGVVPRPLPLSGSGRGLSAVYTPAPDFIFNAHTCSAFVHQSYACSRKKRIPPPLFVLVASQTLPVKS